MADADSPRILVPPPLAIFGTLLAGLAIDGRLTSTTDFQPLAILAAVLLGLAGLALVFVALGLFSRSNTRPEPWQPSSALVVGGIYRRTRNPMYLGMLLVYAALAVLFMSPAAGLLLIPLAVAVDRLIIRREEAYLSRRFGPAYDDYRKSVRRWF
jgi:protein-S-isoprenylcysteine O-methyltransferase Ste14